MPRHTPQNGKFLITPKNDPRDSIAVEIGDTKQPTFFPQVKVMRWDNEHNISSRWANHGIANAQVVQDGDKIKYIGAKKEAHLYELPPSAEHPEGATEFEIVLKEKPDTNVIEFSITSKDIDFRYQHPLTAEELALLPSWMSPEDARPARVVGSYALYAKGPKINYEGGKEYKVGKIGHYYRPWIVDANGNGTWGDLDIQVNGESGIGTLTVTIPQAFLDNAAYPIHHAAGLTFGYTSVGATSGTLDDVGRAVGSSFAGAAGSLTSISLYTKSVDGSTKNFKTGLWLASNGNLVMVSTGASITSASPAWVQDANVSGTISAVSYDICCVAQTGGAIYLYWDSGGSSVNRNVGSYASPGNGTDNFPWTNKYSIYATYSVPPDITTSTGSLSDFGSVRPGATSSNQTFTVAGVDLTANLVVTAPSSDFQVSLSSGSGFGSSVSITPSSGTVSTTTIYARFSPQSTGAKSGNITVTSTGATTDNVAVSGTGSTVNVTDSATVADSISAIAGSASQADTASATDARTLAGTGTVADTGAAADSISSIVGASTKADTASGTDGQSLTAGTSQADTASGADAQTAAGIYDTQADTATAAESATGLTGISESDSATAADSQAAAGTSTEADTANSEDAQSADGSTTAAETASAADGQTHAASIEQSDSATGSDEVGGSTGIECEDGGTGTEDHALAGTSTVTESSTAADENTVESVEFQEVIVDDAATGSDSLDFNLALPVDDTATAADALEAAGIATQPDTATGEDDILNASILTEGDTATGSDDLSAPGAITEADTASASDDSTGATEIAQPDIAAGIDDQFFVASSIVIEASTALENPLGETVISTTDAAAGVDGQSMAGVAILPDTAEVWDAIPQISAEITVTDLSTATEDPLSVVNVMVIDASTATQSIATVGALVINDVAEGTDAVRHGTPIRYPLHISLNTGKSFIKLGD